MEKTIIELYNDKNKEDKNDSMHEITPPNYNSNELREIEIIVIEKSCCKKYIFIFLYFSIHLIVFIIVYIIIFLTTKNKK